MEARVPEATNVEKTVVTASKIEPRSVPGASRERPDEASRAKKREPERNGAADRIFFCLSSEQGATQGQTQPQRGPHGAVAPESRYENSRMDLYVYAYFNLYFEL